MATKSYSGIDRPVTVVEMVSDNGDGTATSVKPQRSISTARLISAAGTTNATLVKSSAGDLYHVTGYNAAAAARYLKIYNKASAPTVGTDAPVWTEYLPAQSRFSVNMAAPLAFSAGIAFALTTGVADNDTGALTAADVVALNISYT